MKQQIIGRYKDPTTGIEILRTGGAPPDPCKECRQEPRRAGSSRCEKCAFRFKQQKLSDARLQKKIEAQSKL